jgi:hypothetical protein
VASLADAGYGAYQRAAAVAAGQSEGAAAGARRLQ